MGDYMKLNCRNSAYKIMVFSAFAFVMFCMHIPMAYFNDDLSFLSGIGNGNIWDFVVERFFSNGKVFTDVLANVFYRLPAIVWKICNACVFVLVAIIATRVFANDSCLDAFIVCTLIGLFPFWYLSTAGWVATTTNYLYPTLCILIVTLVVKNVLNGRKISVWQYFCAAISVIYAANQDQAAMIIIGELSLVLVYCIITKADRDILSRISIFLAFSIVCYIAEFLLPGHLNRLNNGEEMLHWLPEYADWSIGKKIYRAYTATVAELMFHDVALYGVFCLLLFLVGLTSEKVFCKITGMIPLAIKIGSRLLGSDKFLTYPPYAGGMPELRDFGTGFYGLAVLLLSMVALISIVMTVCLCIGNQKSKFQILLLLILGAGSRIMMGFSATLYASHARTFTYILFAIMFSSVLLIRELRQKNRLLYYVSIGVVLASLLGISSPYSLQNAILG